MNINLDDKRIMKIIYQLEDDSVVAYNFRNGELWCVQTLAEDYERYEPTDREMIDKAEKLNLARYKNRIKNMISDSEMIQRIRNSEFMDELEDARKRFKIDKEIADTFPDKDDDGNIKTPNRKYSDESLEVVKEIIKMDREGKLDEILKRHGTGGIDKFIREETESPLRDSELADDSTACQKNMNTIEEKILRKIRMGEGDVTKDKEFEKLVEDYNFYREKKKELDDKIWDNMPKVAPDTCIPVKEAKKKPINPEIIEAIRPLNLSELK